MARMIVALLALTAVAVVSAVKPQAITYTTTDCKGTGSVSAPLIDTTCTAVGASTTKFQTIDVSDCSDAGAATFTRTVWTHDSAPGAGEGCPTTSPLPSGVTKADPVVVNQGVCGATSDTASQILRCPDTTGFYIYGYALDETTPSTVECESRLGAIQFPVATGTGSCQRIATDGATTYYVKGAITGGAAAQPAYCASGAKGTVTVYSDAACGTPVSTAQDFTLAGTDDVESPCANIQSTASPAVPLLNYQVSCTGPSSSSCFSAGSKVTVEDGSEVAIEDVEIGQRVLAVDKFGKTFYDRVFRITHHDHVSTINYVRLTTSEGSVLELSGNHYLHVNACCDLNNVVLADDVKVGDTVFVMKAGSETAAPVAVTKKENVLKQGAFNVHVLNGNIVVNGVVATHFTTESAWQNNNAATAWYHVQDAVYRVTGMAPRPE